jgi:hypothetical protein
VVKCVNILLSCSGKKKIYIDFSQEADFLQVTVPENVVPSPETARGG